MKKVNLCNKKYDWHKKIWGLCWEKYINGKSINGLLMHAERAHYGTFRKKCFISYVRILHVNSLVSIDTLVWNLKTIPGILLSECQDIEGISDMSAMPSMSRYLNNNIQGTSSTLIHMRQLTPYCLCAKYARTI